MKRVFLDTLWIGSVAAAFAIALQMSGLLASATSRLHPFIGLRPNEPVFFGYFLFVIALSFGAAWTFLQVSQPLRRAGLVVFLIADLVGTAWVLAKYGKTFSPLPAILATIIAAILAVVVDLTQASRQLSLEAFPMDGGQFSDGGFGGRRPATSAPQCVVRALSFSSWQDRSDHPGSANSTRHPDGAGCRR